MTWKEFKEWVEAQGVEDDDEIMWMDFHDPEKVDRQQGEDGAWDFTVS